jgi:hypothetical protein
MSHFFVNNFAQSDGNHEVHVLGCNRMPTDKQYLGNFHSVSDALIEARKEFWQSSGCELCARELPIPNSLSLTGVFGVASRGRFR